jgi:hypothetical protein
MKPVADAFSQKLHTIQRAISETQPALLSALAHVAGGADAALEEPRFIVEAMGIHIAVRPSQPHGEEPALAGMDRLGE